LAWDYGDLIKIRGATRQTRESADHKRTRETGPFVTDLGCRRVCGDDRELLEGKLEKDARESLENALRAYEKEPGRLLEILDAVRNFHDFVKLAVSTRAGHLRALTKFNAAIAKQLLHPETMPYPAEFLEPR
jgi:hypothetical protein